MTKTIRLQALGCALAALALAGTTVASILVSNNGHASVLVRMSAAEPMAQFARQADPSFDFVPVQDHYDGVYFYAIAMDPLARGPQHAAI
ncbi:MAG TPA: hypothetical protein VJ891_02270, partial [Casimicrobiaceae bacterium]|nr:hypothetical protein [Casimicrobiaceae bacterium]